MSTSVSAVQAMEMAVMAGKAAIASDMGGDGKCPGCDPADRDMKAMGCNNVPACPAPIHVALTQAPTIAQGDGCDVPAVELPSLAGWAHAPNPYPPRSRIPG